MGFTREFAKSKNKNEKNKRNFSGGERELEIFVDQSTKRWIMYGSHNSKDTEVVINNVTVSFLCLKAAAQWR